MKFSISSIAILSTLAGCAAAYTPSSSGGGSTTTTTRRDVFQKVAFTTGAVVAGSFLSTTMPEPANAIEACPPKSQNCIRTTWTAPSGTSTSELVKTVKEVIEAYPQEGQNDADKGGWTIVESDLFSGSGTKARIEYKSGIGNFAKFFNGGKPFVDDLVLELADGSIEVRSSSRVGESDLGVNQKRLNYLVSALKAKGWDVPEPKY